MVFDFHTDKSLLHQSNAVTLMLLILFRQLNGLTIFMSISSNITYLKLSIVIMLKIGNKLSLLIPRVILKVLYYFQ